MMVSHRSFLATSTGITVLAMLDLEKNNNNKHIDEECYPGKVEAIVS